MKDTVAIEANLDRYLVEHEPRLKPGDRLPDLKTLAEGLDCDPQRLAAALESAVTKSKLVRTTDGGYQVTERAVPADAPRFSFSTTASQLHKSLITALLEPPARRLPVDKKHPLHPTETRAQAALGLKPDEPFYCIARVRHHEGVAKVFHRIYLDPARFPPGLIEGYDFENQSVMVLYRRAGWLLQSRDTVLHARLSYLFEDTQLAALARAAYLELEHRGLDPKKAKELSHLRRESMVQPVLHAEQSFWATPAADPDSTAGRFVLEFLQATYFDHWQYSIHDRGPAG